MVGQAISPSVKRPYGLALVAHCWKFPRAMLYPPACHLDGGQTPPRGLRLGKLHDVTITSEALEPICQGVTKHFGAVAKYIAIELPLRHDHGSNSMSNDFQKEISFLGIKASSSLVREPEGNGDAECFIRPLKENLLWVWDFKPIEELRLAQIDFADWYYDNCLVA